MARANYVIVEESRLVPKDILEQVIKPFLFSRIPPYRLNPLYANENALKEEGIISYITSAWYSSEYWFTYVKSCIRRMANGDTTANFLAFDYLISVFHNIKTEEMIRNEMEDNDDVSVQMEYFNIPSSTSNRSYFKTSLFNRAVKRAFYPQKEDTYDAKKNPYAIPKSSGEVRFVSVDIATRSGRKNDQSIISCIRCLPMLGKGMERTMMYMESHKGAHTGIQSKRIKEIFTDFEADYIVLDLQNAGIKYCPLNK